jgi:hypothetical protein
MSKFVMVNEHHPFFDEEPSSPQEGDLWLIHEDSHYLKVLIRIEDDWSVVTDMSTTDTDNIKISYSSQDIEDIDEDIDYRYRIGAL